MSHVAQLVLRTDPQDFDAAFEALRAALPAGFQYLGAQESALRPVWIHEFVGDAEDAPSVLRLVDDRDAPVRFLLVAAEQPEAFATLTGALRERLPVVAREALFAEARAALHADPAALVRLSVGAGEGFDPQVAALLTEALAAPDARVRRMAAIAASYAAWPELESAVAARLAAEQDPAVQDALIVAREGCRAAGA